MVFVYIFLQLLIWWRGVGCYAFRCFAPFAVNLLKISITDSLSHSTCVETVYDMKLSPILTDSVDISVIISRFSLCALLAICFSRYHGY